MMNDFMINSLTRRQAVRTLGLGVGVAALAACTTTPNTLSTYAVATPANDATPAHAIDHAAPAAQGTATLSPLEQANEMDAMHEAGVKFFVDNAGKDPLFWHNPLPFEMDGDVKVFDVTCTELQWETALGQPVSAMAYNGVVPGPEIRITEGDKVRIICHNEMSQSTSIHFHGVRTPNAMDGVPFITQPPIKPGESFTYEFTAINSGSHMYHSHHNAAEQVTKGLMGAFIIEPKTPSERNTVAYASDYILILNDMNVGLSINGRSFPHTQPIIAKLGETLRIRYMNEGMMIHPMHLHGMPQLVIEKDGYAVPQPYLCDTLNIAPGERYDVLVECDMEGVWAFHCHVLTHAESAHGMFGMVTAIIVQA